MAVIGTGTDVWVLSTEADTIDMRMFVREIKWTGVGTGGDDVKVRDYDSTTVLLEGKGVQYAGLNVVFHEPLGKVDEVKPPPAPQCPSRRGAQFIKWQVTLVPGGCALSPAPPAYAASARPSEGRV